jgi:hypothetical protein
MKKLCALLLIDYGDEGGPGGGCEVIKILKDLFLKREEN